MCTRCEHIQLTLTSIVLLAKRSSVAEWMAIHPEQSPILWWYNATSSGLSSRICATIDSVNREVSSIETVRD